VASHAGTCGIRRVGRPELTETARELVRRHDRRGARTKASAR
jgi:hypothetical protein